MIGIYIITNKINNKCYIGQSINIQNRWNTHKCCYDNINYPLYNSQLYMAMRKYGIENFEFSILIEINQEDYNKEYLNELERHFIEQYNSFKDGYNATPGGEYGVSQKGSTNGNHKLTEDDVYTIREMYESKIPHRDAYEHYKDKINYSGFNKIWNGLNWKHIHMDVYTLENKLYHRTSAKRLPRNMVHNAKLTEEEVWVIKQRQLNGEKIGVVYSDYKDKITKGGFEHIWYERK